MKFILLIGHGSRDENGNEEIRRFARNLIKHKELVNTEVCFLEFGKPDIAKGIENCVSKGASHIIALPVILLPAGHSKVHIPEAIDKARGDYPDVKFSYGTPVGAEIQVLDILSDRLKNHLAEEKNTAILVVGRGSSDPDANSTLFRISRLLWEKYQDCLVETAFMGITKPDLISGLDRCRKLGAERIIVLPYFLFTGVLIERMKNHSIEYQQKFPELEIQMADYFGFHHLLEDILVKKLSEAENGTSQLNCDLCHFRKGHEGHHHRHEHEHHHGHEHQHERHHER